MVCAHFDSAITNRPGARHGLRGLRDQSSLIRRLHHVTHANPFELCKIADVGDTPVNPVNVAKCLDLITEFYRPIAEAGVTPLSVDSDHLIYLPVFRANARDSPGGVVHFDTHTDTADKVYTSRNITTARPSAAPPKKDCSTLNGSSKSAFADRARATITTSSPTTAACG